MLLCTASMESFHSLSRLEQSKGTDTFYTVTCPDVLARGRAHFEAYNGRVASKA